MQQTWGFNLNGKHIEPYLSHTHRDFIPKNLRIAKKIRGIPSCGNFKNRNMIINAGAVGHGVSSRKG